MPPGGVGRQRNSRGVLGQQGGLCAHRWPSKEGSPGTLGQRRGGSRFRDCRGPACLGVEVGVRRGGSERRTRAPTCRPRGRGAGAGAVQPAQLEGAARPRAQPGGKGGRRPEDGRIWGGRSGVLRALGSGGGDEQDGVCSKLPRPPADFFLHDFLSHQHPLLLLVTQGFV